MYLVLSNAIHVCMLYRASIKVTNFFASYIKDLQFFLACFSTCILTSAMA